MRIPIWWLCLSYMRSLVENKFLVFFEGFLFVFPLFFSIMPLMYRWNKKTYRHTLRKIFYRIKSHSGYIRIMTLPFALRISLAIFLFLFGIIGLLTPIPAGWIMILLACVLVFGLRTVRRYSTGLFFRLRLHRVIEYIRYHWRNR